MLGSYSPENTSFLTAKEDQRKEKQKKIKEREKVRNTKEIKRTKRVERKEENRLHIKNSKNENFPIE